MQRLAVLSMLLATAGTAFADDAPESSTPPLSAGRIAGEIGVGFAAGVAGAIVCGVVGAGASDKGGNGPLNAGAAIGITVGWFGAIPLGVYAIGQLGNQEGSLLTTYLAGVLPSAALVGLGVALHTSEPTTGPQTSAKLFALGVLGAPVLATIGFNATRRYTIAPAPIGDGGVALGGSF